LPVRGAQMTRERCTFCDNVISTTDPNKYEGWFVSLEDCEGLEVYVKSLFYTLCMSLNEAEVPRLVLCDECQGKLEKQNG
jgi:hypothetical protein